GPGRSPRLAGGAGASGGHRRVRGGGARPRLGRAGADRAEHAGAGGARPAAGPAGGGARARGGLAAAGGGGPRTRGRAGGARAGAGRAGAAARGRVAGACPARGDRVGGDRPGGRAGAGGGGPRSRRGRGGSRIGAGAAAAWVRALLAGNGVLDGGEAGRTGGRALRRANGAVFLAGTTAGGPLERRAELEGLEQEVRETQVNGGDAATTLERTLAELAAAEAACAAAGEAAERARQQELEAGAVKDDAERAAAH